MSIKTAKTDGFPQLLTPPPPVAPPLPKARCYFDMFVRLTDTNPFSFPGGKREWTIRGDKYSTEIKEMFRHLLSTVVNHHQGYKLMMIFDNTKPSESGEKLVFKLLNGVVKKNILNEYAHLFEGLYLPEKFSYEIKD